MDLENLKQVWNEEKIESIPEISLEKQKEIHTPLEIIRKNMRTELWKTIVAYPFLFILFLSLSQEKKQMYLLVFLIFILVGICCYYYLKFYSFYKKLNSDSFNTYHSLLDLRYELVLNTELYKSLYASHIPTMLCFYIILEMFKKEPNIVLIITQSLLFCAILYPLGKFFLYRKYGRHIQKISNIIREITNEDDDFQYDRSLVNFQEKIPFLGRIQTFFDKKFGKYSGLALVIAIFILIIIVSFLVGFIIGYSGLI
jgi:hypothetical protein